MKPSQRVITGDKGVKELRTDKEAGKSAGSHRTCFECSSHRGATMQCCNCAVWQLGCMLRSTATRHLSAAVGGHARQWGGEHMGLQGLHRLKWVAPFAPANGCWANSTQQGCEWVSDVLASSREADRGSQPALNWARDGTGQLSRRKD